MFKNKFKEKTDGLQKSLLGQSFDEKVNSRFEDKTHRAKYKGLNMAATVLGYIGSALSFIFAALAAFIFLSAMIGPAGLSEAVTALISAPMAIGLAAVIEWLKRSGLSASFDDWFKYRSLDFGAVAMGLFGLVMSVALALYGAKELPAAITDGPDLYNLDSLESAMKAEIAAETSRLTIKKGPHKGLIPYKDRPALSKFKESLQTNFEAKQQANKERKAAHKAEKGDLLNIVLPISATIELLIFLMALYNSNYLFRCWFELQPTTDNEGSAAQRDQNQPLDKSLDKSGQKAEPHAITAKRQIGFNQPKTELDKSLDKSEQPPNIWGDGTCKNCGSTFTKNAHNQKFCSHLCRNIFNNSRRK